jgi:hypothetical protein
MRNTLTDEVIGDDSRAGLRNSVRSDLYIATHHDANRNSIGVTLTPVARGKRIFRRFSLRPCRGHSSVVALPLGSGFLVDCNIVFSSIQLLPPD